MEYRYATKQAYTDYSGGRVFYSALGHPAFPVRLASEIFQRAHAYWHQETKQTRCHLYDPCCGGAYHLAVLAHLHPKNIASIVASDSDAAALTLAQRNLRLLTADGLQRRRQELEQLLATYQKASHRDALTSLTQLEALFPMHPPTTHTFQADALDAQAVARGLAGQRPDIVFADVPYGWMSQWQEDRAGKTAVYQLLEVFHTNLTPSAIIVIACDKKQKAAHPHFQRLERLRVGKRQIFILQPKLISNDSR